MLQKIAIFALGLIILMVVVTSVIGSIKQRRSKQTAAASKTITNKKRVTSRLGSGSRPSGIVQLYSVPDVGGGAGHVVTGITDDGDNLHTININSGYQIQMAVYGSSYLDNNTGLLAPVGLFGFPAFSMSSYIMYGPFVNNATSLPVAPRQLSGAWYATGSSNWDNTSVQSSPYRDGTGVWNVSEMWISQVQPVGKPWAAVTNTGAQNSNSKLDGYCSGTVGPNPEFNHIDADVVLSCLPVGLMSMASFSITTPTSQPDTLIGLGVLGQPKQGIPSYPFSCPEKGDSNTYPQPIVYLWYMSNFLGFQPCSTITYPGVDGPSYIHIPAVTCLKNLVTTAPLSTTANATCPSTCEKMICINNSLPVTASCLQKNIPTCSTGSNPIQITSANFVTSQIIAIQAATCGGFIQILSNGYECVNPTSTLSTVLSDPSYQFRVGNVGSSLISSLAAYPCIVATLESVAYPGTYLSVTSKLIPNVGEYGQFTSTTQTSTFGDYALEFVDNPDPDNNGTIFWTQYGSGWWWEGKGYIAFVMFNQLGDNKTLTQAGGGAGPFPFVFFELPVPFCDNSYTTTAETCSGGFGIASGAIDACLSSNNVKSYGKSCISGFGACGYSIPNTPPNFITLGFKTVQKYMYIWGYVPTIVADVISSYICRCVISYDVGDGGVAGPNTTVGIDPEFGTLGWYSFPGSIDFLDVVDFGYGPLVIWSSTTNIVDRMAQLSSITIYIIDHSTYGNKMTPVKIPKSLGTRDPTRQTKIISDKETLITTFIPMLTGCLCTSSPPGIWLIGDVLQPTCGVNSRFTSGVTNLDLAANPLVQYFELFISDRLLFSKNITVPPITALSPSIQPTGCWIATLEHLPAGLNPVCVDGINFVTQDNTTPRPVCPMIWWDAGPGQNFSPMFTVLNYGPMSSFVEPAVVNTWDTNPTTTYLGVMGIGNTGGENMRVPHYMQLDAIPERPDSVNQIYDPDSSTPDSSTVHFLFTVTGLYIDVSGQRRDGDMTPIKYTPTINLWNMKKKMAGSPLVFIDGELPHLFYQVNLVVYETGQEYVKNVSLSLIGNIDYSSTPVYRSYSAQLSYVDQQNDFIYLTAQPYNDISTMSQDIILGSLDDSSMIQIDDIPINSNSSMDGYLAQIILGTYAGGFLETVLLSSNETSIDAVNGVSGLQSFGQYSFYPAEFRNILPQDYSFQSAITQVIAKNSNELYTNSGDLSSVPPAIFNDITSLDSVCFIDTWDPYGNVYSTLRMVLFYTAKDMTSKYIVGNFGWPNISSYSNWSLPCANSGLCNIGYSDCAAC